MSFLVDRSRTAACMQYDRLLQQQLSFLFRFHITLMDVVQNVGRIRVSIVMWILRDPGQESGDGQGGAEVWNPQPSTGRHDPRAFPKSGDFFRGSGSGGGAAVNRQLLFDISHVVIHQDVGV